MIETTPDPLYSFLPTPFIPLFPFDHSYISLLSISTILDTAERIDPDIS